MSKPDSRPRWNRSSKELQAMLGVSAETISRYVKAGAPRIAHGLYDERAFIPWVIDLHRRRSTATLSEAQARLQTLRGDLAELDLQVKKKNLLPAEEVIQGYGQLVAAFRARILALGSNLAPRILSCTTILEAKEMLDAAAWEALDELSRTPLEIEGRRPKKNPEAPRTKKAKHRTT